MRVVVQIGVLALLFSSINSVSAEVNEVDFSALNQALETDQIADVHSVLVDYHGARIFEGYYEAPDEAWGTNLGIIQHTPDRIHDLRSVSKSVTALVLGLALGDNWEQDMDRTLRSYFPDRASDMGEGTGSITLKDVVTMQAGIEWNEMTEPYADAQGNYSSVNDENRLYDTDDPLGLVLSRDVIVQPGSEWYYNGGLTQLLGFIVQEETGKSFDTFAQEQLFAPLGIEDYEWRRAPNWAAEIPPANASGLRLTARDMAKIGQLILAGGQWNDEQLVNAGWIDAMTARHVENIAWFNEEGMNTGYGFMWYRGAMGTEDVIFAVGNGDQRIMIFPKRQLVITIQAGRYNDFSQPTEKLVAIAVLDAISGDGK